VQQVHHQRLKVLWASLRDSVKSGHDQVFCRIFVWPDREYFFGSPASEVCSGRLCPDLAAMLYSCRATANSCMDTFLAFTAARK